MIIEIEVMAFIGAVVIFGGISAGISYLICKAIYIKYIFDNNTLNGSIIDKDNKISALEVKINEYNEQIMDYKSQIAVYKAEIEQSKKMQDSIQTQNAVQFENLANRIFDEKSKAFKTQSSEGLMNILNPLQEKIKEFQISFANKIEEHGKEQFSLKSEIKNIVLANAKSLQVTENLTKALKGEAKTQGNWGEQILEKLLENAGLIKGEHYTIQESVKNEDGKTIFPDVVINLPEGKKIIIDSKVSLANYEQYISTEDENLKEIAKNSFLKSIKSHIDILNSKEYQKYTGENTLDLSIMFMPIDGTFFFAMQGDNSLLNYALNKNIAISSPLTIIPLLRTISQMWKIDQRVKNVDEMAKKGAALYDKLFGFIDSFKKIGDNLLTAQKNYKEALGRLSEGNGNVLRQAEEFKKIGGLSTKNNISAKENVDKINYLKNTLLESNKNENETNEMLI